MPPSEDKVALKNMIRLINPAHKSPEQTDKSQKYTQLLQPVRPKRQERAKMAMTKGEKEEQEKIHEMKKKLEEEEGFSHEQIEVVDHNMIFFKSVVEVKKRKEEQAMKMKQLSKKGGA